MRKIFGYLGVDQENMSSDKKLIPFHQWNGWLETDQVYLEHHNIKSKFPPVDVRILEHS